MKNHLSHHLSTARDSDLNTPHSADFKKQNFNVQLKNKFIICLLRLDFQVPVKICILKFSFSS